MNVWMILSFFIHSSVISPYLHESLLNANFYFAFIHL
jgi:hypothetical protein